MARRGMANVEAKIFPIEALREFSTRVFLHFGVPKTDAAQAADVLASADLRGIDSHGVARLTSYFDMLNEGLIHPRPKIKILRSTPSTSIIDDDDQLGLRCWRRRLAAWLGSLARRPQRLRPRHYG